MRAQRGAVGAVVLVILAIVLTAFIAVYALRRITTGAGDRDDTVTRITAAVEALDQYASTQRRLPCPADPTTDAGVEVPTGVGAATCTFPEGTLPWLTLGLAREAGYDSWGLKISYRVYTGNKGSLTQPGGIDMTECDTVEPTTGSTTASAGSAGGLCVSNINPALRTTSAAKFLQGKALPLSENGVPRANVAYVVMSHGSTGFGAYTASGVRRDLPVGDERSNLDANGPFTIKAFSDPDTAATAGSHFDDLVAFRTLPDLVKRAGLAARDWPEPDPTVTTALTFDAATLAAVTGTTPDSTTPLANSLDFGNAVVTGYNDSGTPPALSYDSSAAGGGLGVGGTYFSGIYGFLNNLLTNYGGEYLRLNLTQKARMLAVTLNDIGLTDYGVYFQVELRFYSGSTNILTVQKYRCSNSGQLASFSVTAPADFDRVEIQPRDSAYYAALSAFLVSEVKGCTVDATSCRTNLALAAVPANSTDCP